MKLNTLNTIIDDIILELRNSLVNESEHLSRILIEQWVINYRALLIKLDIDKGRDINPMYVLTISNIQLNRVEDPNGHFTYTGNIEVPKLIDFHFKTGLVTVTDLFGNIIQIGHNTKVKYLKYRKYTLNDYLAYLKDNKIYVEGDNNKLEYININIIAENPADVASANGTCFDPDAGYPIPANMISVIKLMIFLNELNIMPRELSDDTNDGKDDNINTKK